MKSLVIPAVLLGFLLTSCMDLPIQRNFYAELQVSANSMAKTEQVERIRQVSLRVDGLLLSLGYQKNTFPPKVDGRDLAPESLVVLNYELKRFHGKRVVEHVFLMNTGTNYCIIQHIPYNSPELESVRRVRQELEKIMREIYPGCKLEWKSETRTKRLNPIT